EHERKIRDVKNWRGMQMHRTFLKREPKVGVIDVLQNICMPHLNTFRPASRAAGVDESENRIRIVNRIWKGIAPNFQRLLVEHKLPGNLCGWDRQRRMTDQAARIGVAEDAVDFFNRKPCVQWNYDYSEPGAGINELDVIWLIGKKNGQPISGLEALPG